MTLTDYEKYHLHEHVYNKKEIDQLLKLMADRIIELEKDIDTAQDDVRFLPDNNKSAFVLWAEENGTINSGKYEWSFGNGGDDQSEYGFPMPIRGRIVSAATCIVCADGSTPGEARVAICINGFETGPPIIHPPGRFSSLTIFDSENILLFLFLFFEAKQIILAFHMRS